jgi:hypothetical protein
MRTPPTHYYLESSGQATYMDTYIKNINQHIHFLVQGHSSWSTLGYTPSEGPKGFVN